MHSKILILAILLLSGSAPALAANTDELWEIRNAVEMQGISMPSSTQTSCQAKNQAYQPEPADKNCTVSNVKVSGNKTSWNMRCTGKDAMEGSAVMTKTATSMDGVMTMIADGERMTMKMSGRLTGKCDAVAERKKFDGMIASAKARGDEEMARAEDLQRKNCEDARRSAASYKGYGNYQRIAQNGNSPEWKSYQAKCKINLEANREALCKKATVNEFDFAKEHCPDQYAALKLELCAGRSSSNRDICGGDSAAAATGGNPAKSILDGAKGLFGAFGF